MQIPRLFTGGYIAIIALVFLIFLREVFSGRWLINPIALSVGPLEIRWYGIIIAVGIVIAMEWTARRTERMGLDRSIVERTSWWAVLGGILGARLAFVLQNIPYFSDHLDRILAFTDGGLSIHGALLGGAIALYLSLVIQRPAKTGSKDLVRSFLRITDAVVPGLLFAMILGRLGNFANAELFGPPTDLLWKMFVPITARPEGLTDVAFYHPTFLYDIILNSIVLLLLLKFESTMKQAGQLTLWFFFGIAVTRFIVEFWRIGDTYIGIFSLAQIVSLGIVALALGSIWMMRSRFATQHS